MSDIGLRIRSKRKEKRLSQTELAQLAGIARSSLQRFESGASPKSSTINKLAEVLECSPDWLLTGHEKAIREFNFPDRSYDKPIERDDFFKYAILYLEEMRSHPDPDYRGWFKIEFLKRFPEFEEWIKKQRQVVEEDIPQRPQTVGGNSAA